MKWVMIVIGLLLALVLGLMLSSSKVSADQWGGCGGCNGDIKVHGGTQEPNPINKNNPKVCSPFHLHGLNFDPLSNIEWQIENWPGGQVVLTGTLVIDTFGVGRTEDFLSWPEGMYKLFWHQEGCCWNKFKVFMVQCPTPTRTSTSTNTPTATPTLTSIRTATASSTTTKTRTSTPTATQTKPCPTLTKTPTRTATKTPTSTSTRTRMRTRTSTPTRTPTEICIPTRTNTHTQTATHTATTTPTSTATYTATPTNTSTPTATPTPISTQTGTATRTPTQTSTKTTTVIGTQTSTSTATPTPRCPTRVTWIYTEGYQFVGGVWKKMSISYANIALPFHTTGFVVYVDPTGLPANTKVEINAVIIEGPLDSAGRATIGTPVVYKFLVTAGVATRLEIPFVTGGPFANVDLDFYCLGPNGQRLSMFYRRQWLVELESPPFPGADPSRQWFKVRLW